MRLRSLVHCLANAVVLKQATEKGCILILNKFRSYRWLLNRKIAMKYQVQLGKIDHKSNVDMSNLYKIVLYLWYPWTKIGPRGLCISWFCGFWGPLVYLVWQGCGVDLLVRPDHTLTKLVCNTFSHVDCYSQPFWYRLNYVVWKQLFGDGCLIIILHT